MHIDQSTDGAELAVRNNFPDLATSLLSSTPLSPDEASLQGKKRWAIMNLWRPLNTIYKDPLAVACASSIAESDLVEVQVVYTKQLPPRNVSKTWSIRPSEKHEWYYKNEMTREEVLVIKCFDTEAGDRLAKWAPHCAFVDSERSGEEWLDRGSVEVRAILVW